MRDHLTESAPAPVVFDGELLLDPEAAAKRLGVAIQTLARWRTSAAGPRFVRLSARLIRYRARDLDEFVEARLRDHTTDRAHERGTPA